MALSGTENLSNEAPVQIIVQVDPDLPIETRLEVLNGEFVMQTRGGVLLTVEKWDLAEGLVQFMIKERRQTPRGQHSEPAV